VLAGPPHLTLDQIFEAESGWDNYEIRQGHGEGVKPQFFGTQKARHQGKKHYPQGLGDYFGADEQDAIADKFLSPHPAV
jgi:hypothetical protein